MDMQCLTFLHLPVKCRYRDPNTGLVWYLNGKNQSSFQMCIQIMDQTKDTIRLKVTHDIQNIHILNVVRFRGSRIQTVTVYKKTIVINQTVLNLNELVGG